MLYASLTRLFLLLNSKTLPTSTSRTGSLAECGIIIAYVPSIAAITVVNTIANPIAALSS